MLKMKHKEHNVKKKIAFFDFKGKNISTGREYEFDTNK